MGKKMKVLVIVCARNEEANISRCLESILAQTHGVQKIIVVDDRSSDRTGEVVNKISNKNPMILQVRIVDQGADEHSKRIPMAFNAGLEKVNLSEYDVLSKIDADMLLSNDYFEKAIRFLEQDRTVGITGGIVNNEPTREVCGGNMVIRMDCWSNITERRRMPIVDSEDAYLLIKAKMKNWKTILLFEAVSYTMRPYSLTSLKKKVDQRSKVGKTAYRFGYHPLYLIGRVAVMSVRQSPYLLTPILVAYGWILSWLTQDRHDKAFRDYVRSSQRIFVGTRRRY